MSFPCVGIGPDEWHLTAAKLAEYEHAFPGADVPAELRKARQWLIDNPARRKTARGMTRYLGNWLGRAQDQCSRRGPSAAPFRNSAERIMDQVYDALLDGGKTE